MGRVPYRVFDNMVDILFKLYIYICIYVYPNPNPMKRNQPMYVETPFVSCTVCVNHFLEQVVSSTENGGTPPLPIVDFIASSSSCVLLFAVGGRPSGQAAVPGVVPSFPGDRNHGVPRRQITIYFRRNLVVRTEYMVSKNRGMLVRR